MSMCLDAALVAICMPPMTLSQKKSGKTWEKVAAETLRLDVIPPGAFEQPVGKETAVNPCPMNSFRFALARMLCADWWYRKLWKMRCEWREEQLRAVCPVSKKHLPMSAMKP